MKYKVLLHWDDFRKYSPREGEIDVDGNIGDEQILERIFVENQNDFNPKPVPSASELDVIEFEDGRRFRILDIGFNELCSKPEDRYCQICSKFYLNREDVPKAKHMNIKNTFYKNGKNNLCDRCFREYGVEYGVDKEDVIMILI